MSDVFDPWVAVLGAGPHGRQIAKLIGSAKLYDDNLDGYRSIEEGARAHRYVIGAAWPDVRRQVAAKLAGIGEANGTGVVAFPGARLGCDVELGEHVHILFNAVISHGCKVGHFSTICAGAVLAGEVEVGEGVLIGANATVLHGGIRIGAGATVGAGAVVTHDVEPGETVIGVPAQRLALA